MIIVIFIWLIVLTIAFVLYFVYKEDLVYYLPGVNKEGFGLFRFSGLLRWEGYNNTGSKILFRWSWIKEGWSKLFNKLFKKKKGNRK